MSRSLADLLATIVGKTTHNITNSKHLASEMAIYIGTYMRTLTVQVLNYKIKCNIIHASRRQTCMGNRLGLIFHLCFKIVLCFASSSNTIF